PPRERVRRTPPPPLPPRCAAYSPGPPPPPPPPRRDAEAGWAWAHTVGTALVVLLALGPLACGGGSHQTPAPQSLTETLAQFLSAVQASDFHQMGALWGTERGPATDWMKAEDLRQRLTVIQKYL